MALHIPVLHPLARQQLFRRHGGQLLPLFPVRGALRWRHPAQLRYAASVTVYLLAGCPRVIQGPFSHGARRAVRWVGFRNKVQGNRVTLLAGRLNERRDIIDGAGP